MPRWSNIAQLYEHILLGVLGFGPLILLAWKNVGAVPIGLLAFLSIFMLTFGFFIFMTSPSRDRPLQILAAIVLTVLTVFSFRIAGNDFSTRIRWSGLSLVAWMMASMFGRQLIDNIQRDRRFAKARAERAAEESGR